MVNFLGKEIRSPLFISSGIVGDFDGFYKISLDSYGFVILKTITVGPREGNPPPRVLDGRCAMFNSIGLANEGLEGFLECVLHRLSELPVPAIVSISLFSVDEVQAFLPLFEKELWAIEINLSCPNVSHNHSSKRVISQDVYLSCKIVEEARRKFSGKLIAKVSPEVDDLPTLARDLVNAGVDALDIANTYLGLVLDLETRRPVFKRVFAGVSGPAILPLTLRRIWEVYESVDVAILGSGGVSGWEDAIAMALSGATMVGIGSALYRNPNIGRTILSGVVEYLNKKGLSWKNLVGAGHGTV